MIPIRLILPLMLMTGGCASMFLHGGELVKAKHSAQILINYKVEGSVPAGVTYHLVKFKDKGEAFFERSTDGSGVLVSNQWREKEEDHFFVWVGSSHGYEYVIPVDRKKPGRKYVYPAGYFSVRVENGVEKPTLAVPLDPVATFIPQ